MIDIFKVAVHVGMTTNATQILGAMISQLTGVHVAANKLQQSLGTIRQAAIGAAAVFVGWEVGKGIWHAIEGNRELNKELEKTKQLGGDFAANVGNTRAAAFRTANEAPTSVVSDNVRLAREVGVTIGKPREAEEMLTEASKTAFVVSHFTGENQEDIIKNLMRTADARAQIYKMGPDGKEHVDPERLTAEMNAAARGLILGGGFLKSSDLLQMTRQGGAAVKAQTPEAFYATGVEAGIALGASKTGTAETGLMQQFIGGTMTKKVAEHLTEAGLLHPGDWHSGRSGGVVVNPQVAQRFEPLMKDPVAWLTTGEGGAAMKQYAAKNGIDTMMAIFQLFGRQTVQRLVSEITSNEPQFERARQIYGGIPSVDKQYTELQGHDLDTNMIALSAAWKSFMEAFSDAGIPLVIPFLHGLTDVIHFMMNGAAEYPRITEGLIGIAGGIAALTALSGSIVVLNLVWGPLATGLRLLAGVGGLSALGPALSGVATGLGSLTALSGLAALGAGLAGVAVGVGALYAVLKLGSDHETPATQAAREQIRKGMGVTSPSRMAPQDGYDVSGKPSAPTPASPYVPPPAAKDGTGKRSGDVYLDGKKVGMILDGYTADRLSRPPTGGNSPDYRISPLMPGVAFG